MSIYDWFEKVFGNHTELVFSLLLLLFGVLMLVIRHVTIALSNKYIKPKESKFVTDVTYTLIHDSRNKTVYKFTKRLFDIKVSRTEYEDNEVTASRSVRASKDLMLSIQNVVEDAGIKQWPSLSISSTPTDRTLFVAYGMVTYFMLNIQDQPESAEEMFAAFDRMVRELGL